MRIGVDEAGKGPVLGSMFAAAVAVTDPKVLPDGVDDSKRLAPETRERLDDRLRGDDRVQVAVAEITPARIDDPATDMNALTVAAHANAISRLAADGDDVVVDAGDVSESRFARRVRTAATADVDVTAEHGADETHPVVAAASVVAKVARDAQMTALASEHGAVGSGYPSDPTTREFLATHVADHGQLPAFARESWSTSADVLAAAEQSGLDDF
ncbi:ribonuclease HII [Halorubellus sp. JP-L1]|uniref:ribonuclease HII n=1 Tax=Halorubellus sp. JP-L1 TaxID=2715753 RepID=UPI00140C7F5B|nr:ribonuclease HII [Halorubellus sp. JP-L1]NHN41545.1 ribonuclease HII [Halorubellus sp. JP-L1]